MWTKDSNHLLLSLIFILLIIATVFFGAILIRVNPNLFTRANIGVNPVINGDFETGNLTGWVLCGGAGYDDTSANSSQNNANYQYSRTVSESAVFSGKNGFDLMVSESGRKPPGPNNAIAGICQLVKADEVSMEVKPIQLTNTIYNTLWIEASDTGGSITYSYNTAGNFWTGDIKRTLSLNQWNKLNLQIASDYQQKYNRPIHMPYLLKIWGRADEGTSSVYIDDITGTSNTSNANYPFKAAAFDDGGTSNNPAPFARYNDLHIDYIYGTQNQTTLNFVKTYGAQRWIPVTTFYPSTSPWTQFAKYGSPDYAVCFNEENGNYHPAWDETTTENYLVRCIQNYKSVWPNTKIIVNLGAQDDNAPKNAVFFPAWPESVWGAFARHLDQIDGFGIHIYPENCPPKAVPPGYQYGFNSDDTKFVGCTQNYIKIAKDFLKSKGADSKFLTITEWGISDVNSNNYRVHWRSTPLWQQFWDMLKNENIELFSVYATAWRYDAGDGRNDLCGAGFPGGLVDLCTMNLTQYGQAYAQMQQRLTPFVPLSTAESNVNKKTPINPTKVKLPAKKR